MSFRNERVMTTPADEIRQAIITLEKLRDDSTPGPWVDVSDDYRPNWILGRAATQDDGYYGTEDVLLIQEDNLDGAYLSEPDTALIVTLHRTIEPVLAILRAAVLAELESEQHWAEVGKPYLRGPAKIVPINRAALDLARAINGEAS